MPFLDDNRTVRKIPLYHRSGSHDTVISYRCSPQYDYACPNPAIMSYRNITVIEIVRLNTLSASEIVIMIVDKHIRAEFAVFAHRYSTATIELASLVEEDTRSKTKLTGLLDVENTSSSSPKSLSKVDA